MGASQRGFLFDLRITIASVGVIALIVTVWSADPAHAEEPTPIAGEEFRTTLFGEEIYVPPPGSPKCDSGKLWHSSDSEWPEPAGGTAVWSALHMAELG